MRKYALSRIDRYFKSLSHKEAEDLAGALDYQIERLNIRYFNDYGKPRQIQLVLRPWLIRPEEERFFRGLIYTFQASQNKLFELYLKNKSVRQILPLRDDEEEWFGIINKDKPVRPQVVFGRWDTNVSFAGSDNIGEIKFMEVNTVGIGGIHYIPVVSQALKNVLGRRLGKCLYPSRLAHQADPRALLARQIKAHARVIGRPRLNVAFIENREFIGGTVELPEIREYFRGLGINAVLADPRDLRLKGSEIYCHNLNIDIIYRDSELQELIDLEKKGHNMAALRQAFINNQVISSIAGELDHKSGFEIFSSPEFAHFFSRKETELFRRYISWTRLLKERHTTDMHLRRVDLVPYTIKNKDTLVLKPNRAYGGKGVVIGRLASQKDWQAYIRKAIETKEDYVVQSLAKIKEEEFPFLNSRKQIEFGKFYSVSGFIANRSSTVALGRFSKDIVVNVARNGGIIPAFLLHCK